MKNRLCDNKNSKLLSLELIQNNTFACFELYYLTIESNF
jgi:hypothetical protein